MKRSAIRLMPALAIALFARMSLSAEVGKIRDPDLVSLPFLSHKRTYFELDPQVIPNAGDGNSTWGAMTAVEASIHRLKQLASDMLRGVRLRNGLSGKATLGTEGEDGEAEPLLKTPSLRASSHHGWEARAHGDHFAPFMPANTAEHSALDAPRRSSAGGRVLARKSRTPLSDTWRLERLAPRGHSAGGASGELPARSSTSPRIARLAFEPANRTEELMGREDDSHSHRSASTLPSVQQPDVQQHTAQQRRRLSCVCDGLFKEGDRVHMVGAVYPFGRTTGTVLSGTDNGNLNIQWDGWAGGHTGNCEFTTCGKCEESAAYSRWFTRCSDVSTEHEQ